MTKHYLLSLFLLLGVTNASAKLRQTVDNVGYTDEALADEITNMVRRTCAGSCFVCVAQEVQIEHLQRTNVSYCLVKSPWPRFFYIIAIT